MTTIIFRTRIEADTDMVEPETIGVRMAEVATAMPGFVSYKDFAADEGETLSLIEIASADTLVAWRNHPEHREAQQRGREVFFSAYPIQECEPIREYSCP